MDWIEHNRQAWNRAALADCEWSRPVSAAQIEAARAGEFTLRLTPLRPVPRSWLGLLVGQRLLCLASAGGQQAPLLAAAGAEVTSLDLSDEQLRRDTELAEAHRLPLRCVRGDMRDLSHWGEGSFDCVFHPVANLFIPELAALWSECHRVLRPGGRLLVGFMNPSLFLFDHDEAERSGDYVLRYRLPYGEPDSLQGQARVRFERSARAAEFSHSLDAQLGGQLRSGFVLTDLYEDSWNDPESKFQYYSPVAIATRAIKMDHSGAALAGHPGAW